MIERDKRRAIYSLHEAGMCAREISRKLNISRNTVDTIIAQKGDMPDPVRVDSIEVDADTLRRLYLDCGGFVQRIHEKLSEEEGITIGYSTLTRKVRQLGLLSPKNERCARVPDEAGSEMQHDTTIYKLKIGGQQTRVVASILYLRYSKIKYLKFYPSFNRFAMKCFLHEALTFWGYTARVCIIDNTNLARLRGTGKNAIMVPEMEQFGKRYGFKFCCHAINHPNRKAGNERSFYTVETNFLPGRSFESFEDLNKQAYDWATERMANRAVSKTGLIPAKAFEYEQTYLIKLPPYIQPPYLEHHRIVDQYGYVSFAGNFYWVPGSSRHYETCVLQYSNLLQIHHNRKLLAEYQLPPDEVKNKLFSPEGMPKPEYKPKHRKKPTGYEEKKLRAASVEVDEYLNLALKPCGKEKHRFIRQLFVLYQKLTLPIFINTIKRALKYSITDMKTIERIALLQLGESGYEMPCFQISEELYSRESYLEGQFCDEVDLFTYDKLLEEKKDG